METPGQGYGLPRATICSMNPAKAEDEIRDVPIAR
jgi:hypothetical protein